MRIGERSLEFSKSDCCPDFLFRVMAEYLTDLNGLDEQ